MKTNKPIANDFTTTIERGVDNTLNFENISTFTSYVSNKVQEGNTSIYNLYMIDNIILDKFIPYLKDTSDISTFNDEEEYTYRNRPWQLSNDKYGVIDYWYIILAVNGYMNPYEFKGFKKLYIPKISVLEDLINKEIYKTDKIGIANL